MKGVFIHGILLAIMLVYGFRTLTRDTKPKADLGSVVVFSKREQDIARIRYQTANKTITLERRGQGAQAYWWGTEVRTEKKPKPMDPTIAAVPADAKGTPALPPKPPVAEFEEVEVTSEFPVSDAAQELVGQLAGMRALRQLASPSPDDTKAFGLAEKTAQLTVEFSDGTHVLTVGGRVSGGSERYALDVAGKRLLIIAGALVDPLAGGETGLRLVDPKGFDAAKVESITIAAQGKERKLARGTGKDDTGKATKTWVDVATGEADQTAANVVSTVDRLRPSKYKPEVDLSAQPPLATVTYRDKAGAILGTLSLYAKDQEFYLVTPRARAPGLLDRSMGSRVEGDLTTLFQ